MTDENKSQENQTFEDAMSELETIVKKLEENEVPLEEAIHLFQHGMQLSKGCHDRLQKVEKQMDQVLKKDGKMEPFGVQGEDTP